VLSVVTNRDGAVVRADVIDSPLPELSPAVISRIRQWRFAVLRDRGSTVAVSSKLTFYPAAVDGTVVLQDPFGLPTLGATRHQ
jgi:hypothetical protein